MANKLQSKCLGCGDIFTVDVRNRGRQKYCPKRVCRAAGKAARQRRWLGKPENQDYFSGSEHVERVRTWRAAHPGIGAPIGAAEALRYKTPLNCKSLKPLKI
jgi:hypothetical protein